jgi:hypothetical protein
MNTLIALEDGDMASIKGGTSTAGQSDNLARDIGQFVGGFYGSIVAHPILTNLPFVGPLFSNGYGFLAATN